MPQITISLPASLQESLNRLRKVFSVKRNEDVIILALKELEANKESENIEILTHSADKAFELNNPQEDIYKPTDVHPI